MINREDMLALTRRMTVKRTSITRIAGSYMDEEGFSEGTFNTQFSESESGRKGEESCTGKSSSFF